MTFGCYNCGNKIETLFLGKKYCGPRCRKQAENRRARDREGAARDPVAEKRTDALVVHHCPTLAMLEGLASVYVNGGTTKPSVFTGTIPAWTSPAGVMWIECSDRSWLMTKDDSVEFSTEHQLYVPPEKKEVRAVDVLNEVLGEDPNTPKREDFLSKDDPLYIPRGTPDTDFTDRYKDLPLEQPGISIEPKRREREEKVVLTEEQLAYVAQCEQEEKELLADL